MGCATAFDYNYPELASLIVAAKSNQGVNVILDMSGGGKELKVPLKGLMAHRVSLTGSFLGSTPLREKREVASELRDRVWPPLGTAIRSIVDAIYPLALAAEAHRHSSVARR